MVLNTASVRAGRRNLSFLCMCSIICIFDLIIIIIINIVFVVVVVIPQNWQVTVTSFGFCWYSGGAPTESRLLEFL